MTGETRVYDYANRVTPDEWLQKSIGPYSHGGGSGQLALPTNNTSNYPLGFKFDRPGVIDKIEVMADTIATATRTYVLYWAADGQTMAAAVSAGQALTGSIDFATLVAATATSVPVLTTFNTLPAGARLFINSTNSSADTALSGANFHFRWRTRQS